MDFYIVIEKPLYYFAGIKKYNQTWNRLRFFAFFHLVGLMLFTFSFKCPLCSPPPTTWHLVTVCSSGWPLTLQSHHQQRHTYAHTYNIHSVTHNGSLVIPTECTGSLPSTFERTEGGTYHDVGMAFMSLFVTPNPHQCELLIRCSLPANDGQQHLNITQRECCCAEYHHGAMTFSITAQPCAWYCFCTVAPQASEVNWPSLVIDH